jgi:hypothetical protein
MASVGAGYAKTVQTLDSRELDSNSEEYRLYCEAKFVLSLPDKSDKRRKGWQAVSKREYLAGVRDKRGQVAHDVLRAEMIKLWKLGYRPSQK